MPTTQDVLAEAASILSVESRWCKRAAARRSDGRPCPPLAPVAVAWDLHGALIKATHDLNASNAALHGAYLHLRGKIPSNRRNKDIDFFNDSLTFAQIAPLFS